MKKNNNKGFTLAELLIVVAIIAVLVAIAIPVFTQQLEKSREATDLANLRSAYSELVTSYLDKGEEKEATVPVTQTIEGWQSDKTNGTGAGGYTFIGSDIKVKSGSGTGSGTSSGTRVKIKQKTKTSGGNEVYTLKINAKGEVFDSEFASEHNN